MQFGQRWVMGRAMAHATAAHFSRPLGGCAWGPGQGLMRRAWLEAIARGGMPRDVPGESQGSPKELSRDGNLSQKCPEEILMTFNFSRFVEDLNCRIGQLEM